ncbi:MAG: DUF5665 domain-containing protein [Paracoccaceae bacterium]|jgi:hypothetical protein|uniref:DUF5665 domain-containing protein n=1 Tax=unclassified Seohaeicola TaxID=2641111 RepID=UPI00237A7D62|nr:MULTISPECIES: DUF5665 domain-containing protein [unclassified Seohaeicola]MDD9706563.1 DUF5665 domain-containing protein [Seohaeicola sp. 4SK31]MDD9734269.1 DUF5665 domain-containing protein [Seohaeicola sp. SP36]MDF1706645.1 DUF5665 domain-containing protein [Paracoccaceae bacterium]MDM7968385.1 DUF5665 domain-containing protein [Paracoccaceae bacterium]
MPDTTRPQTEQPLPSDQIEAIRSLARELERLNSHRFVKVHNSMFRLVGFQFARGLAFGLGSVLGASILVSVVAWWLSQIEFLPIIGEWASKLAQEIELPRDVGRPSED